MTAPEPDGDAPAPEMPDLMGLTTALVDIPSVSHDEALIADKIEALLSGAPHLEVRRLANNVLARTSLGRPTRLMLAGHLDTVPANGNERAIVDGDTIHGLGSADMKGGIAVMAEVVRRVPAPTVDVTFVAYACEEIDQRYSGLGEIAAAAPEWLNADAAILGEPTASIVEAGRTGAASGWPTSPTGEGRSRPLRPHAGRRR